MLDLVKFSVPLLYSRNKNLQYKENIIQMSTALLKFLKDENLICTTPFTESGELKKDFEIRESDLTEEGVELFKSAIHKWWKKIDAGLDRSDVSFLKSELEKIKNSKQH
ncbi:hypothetical protein RA263_27385 [Pseudomonas syringae pv. tagetis]|uniref:Uncharacterized protein n=2 Tax=Pseudomonas syringae group TaxID=136849 RepID=A0A0Q0CRN4_9PSED|nr:hypothetical protein [Pseudomonas syringae group genomosp. 7]KPY87361.1 Uncharacterized protein ALO44_04279 [Pseudomonas syringae pv. tagetis]RMW11251.1 hypothetical protein ALO98_200067 [Pseudomonas syringae pv. tagetis]RMW15883.1 hypothetical protein ALO97_200183 [Pseudomonas syringae pv. tagetis]UNB68470.1 hypothetical protein MME58_25430 [Pseudomonas syringae pv. tagetis]